MIALAACVSMPALAAPVRVVVSVENLAPLSSVSFAPLRFGFNNGTFDAFNLDEAATAPIISVAEGGSSADWFPAFAAADPTVVLGSIMGALTPGAATLTAAISIYRISFSAQAIPEPATLGLLFAGLFGIAAARRRNAIRVS